MLLIDTMSGSEKLLDEALDVIAVAVTVSGWSASILFLSSSLASFRSSASPTLPTYGQSLLQLFLLQQSVIRRHLIQIHLSVFS